LRQQIEALKQKLAAEGLFDERLKRPLPAFPRRIGVVTSPTGAAIRDVLTVLRRRFPGISVMVYPVPVQGEGAAAEIRRMLEVADARAECDLLILTRGGGSLEDLMPFNDEALVRAIRACVTPVVSAIGHEIDITLADFAADRRAPTPSAAAELASPDAQAVGARFDDQVRLLRRAMGRRLHQGRLATDALTARLRQIHPGRRLQQRQQRLDELEQRLARHLTRDIALRATALERLSSRLHIQNPDRRIGERRQHLAFMEQRLTRSFTGNLRLCRDRWAALARHLDAVSPLATLGRGYAIVSRTADGRIVTRASEAAVGETVEARLSEGSLICRVEEQLE
jgi:exodeoxyribonuclease VII large subunit